MVWLLPLFSDLWKKSWMIGPQTSFSIFTSSPSIPWKLSFKICDCQARLTCHKFCVSYGEIKKQKCNIGI